MSKPRATTTPKAPEPSWRSILPCPFCGGRGKVLTSRIGYAESEHASSSCVICEDKSCGAGGPVVEPKELVLVEVAERIAIAKWNRRSQHQNADWKLRRIAQILNSEFAGAEA
jgi:hypothetical protein